MADSTLKDLTGGEVEGNGAFDELMRTVKALLVEEFENERIVGADYATVYLGSINAALSTASNMVLQLPIVNQQVLLYAEQIEQAKKQVELVNEQIIKLQADTSLVGKQEDLVDRQILGTEAQTALTNANKLVADEQKNKLTQEILNMGEQLKLIQEQTNLTGQQAANALTENTNIQKTQDKIDAEVAVLTAKRYTEEAQVSDSVNGSSVAGVIGKQKQLYQNQADGFIRDAEQKASKIHADFFTVLQSTDQVGDVSSYGADGPSVKAVLDKMKAGINI